MGGKQYPRGHRPAEVEYEVHQKQSIKPPKSRFLTVCLPFLQIHPKYCTYIISKKCPSTLPPRSSFDRRMRKGSDMQFYRTTKACGWKGRRQAPYRSNFPQAHRSMRWRRSLSSRFFRFGSRYAEEFVHIHHIVFLKPYADELLWPDLFSVELDIEQSLLRAGIDDPESVRELVELRFPSSASSRRIYMSTERSCSPVRYMRSISFYTGISPPNPEAGLWGLTARF